MTFFRQLTLVSLACCFGLTAGLSSSSQAITSVAELQDVKTHHWAYDALEELVEKYNVIEGYPDGTFKGDQQPNRLEMAAALNALIKAIGRDLARLGSDKASRHDLATLAKLQQEFASELGILSTRINTLETRHNRMDAKNATQNTRLNLLEKTQFHGDVSFGILADNAPNGLGIGEDNGILDGMTSIGRLRLTTTIPVVEDFDDSRIGQGEVVARLVGAFGRWSPQGGGGGATNITGLTGYSGIAGDASIINEGVRPDSLTLGAVTTGLNLRPNLYVDTMYYHQHFKPGIPFLTDIIPGNHLLPDDADHKTTADIYAGVMRWRDFYAKSPYRGNALNQFQNGAFLMNPGILANLTVPTTSIAFHKGLGPHASVDAMASYMMLDQSDVFNGFMFSEELNLNYNTALLSSRFQKPGNIYVGGNHLAPYGNTNLSVIAGTVLNRDGTRLLFNKRYYNHGFYAGWNQEWWRGIGTSIDYALNTQYLSNLYLFSLQNGTGANASFNAGGPTVGIGYSLTGTLSIPLTAFHQNLHKRSKDMIGLGFAWIRPWGKLDGATFDQENEYVAEAYYRFVLSEQLSIVPSVQLIGNRFGVGNNDISTVFGLRSNFTF